MDVGDCSLDINLGSLVKRLVSRNQISSKIEAILTGISHWSSLGQGALGGSRISLMRNSVDWVECSLGFKPQQQGCQSALAMGHSMKRWIGDSISCLHKAQHESCISILWQRFSLVESVFQINIFILSGALRFHSCDTPIWLIVWCVWVCDESYIGYLLGRSELY